VTRDELFELLWPADLAERSVLGARLSVQLAAVRRVLRGGVIADRSTVRLDTTAVQLDVAAFQDAIDAGRNAAAARLHRGPFLPEDPDEEWATKVRERTTIQQRGALAHIVQAATSERRRDEALAYALRWRDLDPYDVAAHHAVINSLVALARTRDAEQAHATYSERMAELDATALPLAALSPHR
jgi:DNA-binding SARP family transcriptional activator